MDFLPQQFWNILLLIVIFGAAYLFKNRSALLSRRHDSTGLGTLAPYVTNFTELARSKKLEPVIGRRREVEQLVRVLSRKNKNNALLLGEPGVGKTAVVEHLAQLIVTNNIPESLQNKTVLSLDLASLIAGTKYRGELEQRIEGVRNTLEKEGHHLILFIDEIHQLSEARGSEGGLNPADILKPSLARGDMQVIGATTYEEYEKYIVPDESLERRFHPIHIHEATEAQALHILQAVKVTFEEFHHVQYPDATLSAIVELAKTYIPKRYFPDKAIDILDEAGVRTHIDHMKSDATAASQVSIDVVKAVVADWIDVPVSSIVYPPDRTK